MTDDTDDISELAKRLRSTDAPPADDRDDEEPLEGFARKFRGSDSPFVAALADAFPLDLPLTGLLAEPSRQPDPFPTTRRVDLRLMSVGELRDLRDDIDRELDRRPGGEWL